MQHKTWQFWEPSRLAPYQVKNIFYKFALQHVLQRAYSEYADCNTQQHTATRSNTLQHTHNISQLTIVANSTYSNRLTQFCSYPSLQLLHIATHCNMCCSVHTLSEHTATRRNTQQHTTNFCSYPSLQLLDTATHCNMLLHTATYCCNTLAGVVQEPISHPLIMGLSVTNSRV